MSVIKDENNLQKKKKYILSKNINVNNNNIFLLKKMLKANKNKRKLNLSNKKQISKYIKNRCSNKTNIISHFDNDFEMDSFSTNNYVFGNAILANVMKNSDKDCNIKSVLNENKNMLLAQKEIIYNKYNNNYNNRSKINASQIKKINYANSVDPLILDCNDNLKQLENIINLKENFYYCDNIPKIMAFKENIFVHEKNILLDDNTKDCAKQQIHNNISNMEINNILNKSSKSLISEKFKRPGSAVYGFNDKKYKNKKLSNMQINDVSVNNKTVNKRDAFLLKIPKKIFDDNYYDLSYVNNKKKNIIQNSKMKFNRKNENIIIAPQFNYLYEIPQEQKMNINDNYILNNKNLNFEDINKILNARMSISNKEKDNRNHIFPRRSIHGINKKLLIYLPKGIKKYFNNKYNFFSYLMSDEIDFTSSEKRDMPNVNKNKDVKNKKKNKIKHNKTDYNFIQNYSNKNIFTNYKLNCRKEEEFMSYLKQLDYIEKHKNLSSNRNDKIIYSGRIHKTNNIYKPVKIKVDNSISNSIETIKKNNEIYDKKIDFEEDNEFWEKIKSQPFRKKSNNNSKN